MFNRILLPCLLRAVFILILMTLFNDVRAQIKPITNIDSAASLIAMDNLDNLYVVTEKNELLKYNSSGKVLWRYSNKSFGKPDKVDASDPLRILLYYSNYQQLVILNNNLNEISRYRFSRDPGRLVTLIASANNNGFWIYDQLNRELIKMNNAFNTEQQSGNIYIQTGIDVQPQALHATDQFVYLYDAQTGVLEFDRFGKYSRTILTGDIKDFDVDNNSLKFISSGGHRTLNFKTHETTITELPLPGVLQLVTGNKLMGVLTEKGVFLYPLLH